MTLSAPQRPQRAAAVRWAFICVPACLVLGFLAGQLAQGGPGNPWFAGLLKPAIHPPPVVFGIVWPILYALMGVALALVIAARGAPWRRAALAAFAVQFAVNLAWTPVFFGAHRIGAALGVIAVLDGLVILTIALFMRVRRRAGLLLLPYLGWILFATALNYQFLALNPAADAAGPAGARIGD